MKLKYVGDSFGVDSLTNEKTYECLGEEGPFYRIIDDSGEDYLYSKTNPAPLNGSSKGWQMGMCEIMIIEFFIN